MAKQKRAKEQERPFGMAMPVDDGRTATHDEAALFDAMAATNAKGGSVFMTAMQLDNPDGLEFGAPAVRAVSERLAREHPEKE